MTVLLLHLAEISLSMSAVILLVLLVLKVFGKKFTAKCRYILWCVVMLRLAIPVGGVFLPALIEVPVVTEHPVSPVPAETADAPETAAPADSAVPQTPGRAPSAPVTEIPASPETNPTVPETPAVTEALSHAVATETETAAVPETEISEQPHRPFPVLPVLSVIWVAGAILFLFWNLISYTVYTASVLRDAAKADLRISSAYASVCRALKMRRPPLLRIAPHAQSPAAFGLFRRVIVLPDIPLSGDALAGVLLHEATHCARGDLAVKAVILAVRAMHWFNPLVHLAARRCGEEMELSCDEAVLAGCGEDSRIRYGDVMLDIVRRCRGKGGSLTTRFDPKKEAVKHRLLNIRYGSGKGRGRWLITLCLTLCILAGAVVSCRDSGADPDTTDTTDASASTDSEDTAAPVPPSDGISAGYRTIPMLWAEESALHHAVERQTLSREEIIGLAHTTHTDAAPVTVDAKTVLVLKTKTGYAAVWTNDPYVPGEIPTGELYLIDEIDMTGAAAEPSIVLTSYPDALYGHEFTFGWGWSSATSTLYRFDDYDGLWEMDSLRGYFAQSADADGDGREELIVLDLSHNPRLWDWEEGTYRVCDLKATVGDFGHRVTWREETGDFAVEYYKNGDPGTHSRTARIVRETVYLWDEPAGWKLLAQDSGANAFLFGLAENTDALQSIFRVTVNRTEAMLTTLGAAWVRDSSWMPKMYFADVTGDGTGDAVVILTTGTGTGVHVEELYVVDGIRGEVLEVPAPSGAVSIRVTQTEEGKPAVRDDSGDVTVIPTGYHFKNVFRFAVSGDGMAGKGVITAEVPVGYGVLQYTEDTYTVTYECRDGAFRVSSVKKKPSPSAAQTEEKPSEPQKNSGKLLIGTYGVPVTVYGRDDLVVGSAEVTLSYSEILHDPHFTYWADSIGPEFMKVIRCDEPGVSEAEIFAWFLGRSDGMYDFTVTKEYTADDGFRFPTVRFFGENGREYMYMMQLAPGTWLCLDHQRDDAARVENEAEYFDKAASRVEVPEIRWESAKLAGYVRDCLEKKMTEEFAFVYVGENRRQVRLLTAREEEGLYIPTSPVEEYLDVLQPDKWTVQENFYLSDLAEGEDTLEISVGSGRHYRICSTLRDDVMAMFIPTGNDIQDELRVNFLVPAGTAGKIAQLATAAIDAREAARQARFDAMEAFLPEGATERLVKQKIFMSEDYILSFRTRDGSLSLWRAEDIGSEYVPLTLEIPERYTYDYYEVVGCAGGGGSGEYNLLFALYDGDQVEYALAPGWFREPPVVSDRDSDWLTADFLMSHAAGGGVFPNKTVPRAIDDLAEWDVLGIEATTAYYGESEDIRLAFLRAFFANDTARLEKICGMEEGLYDSWKGMHFKEWVVYVRQNAQTKQDEVLVSFLLDPGESTAFPSTGYAETYVVEESLYGALLRNVDHWYADNNWASYSSAVKALRVLFSTVTATALPTDDDMDAGLRWQITEYLCHLLGEGLHPVEKVVAAAESVFGIRSFTPDVLHVEYAKGLRKPGTEEGYWCCSVPHGGSVVAYLPLAYREAGDVTTVTVQFYADPSRTVKSDHVTYTFTKDEDVPGGFR
ncbi:MAG: hypothetical protein IJD06_12125, partial [Clostridia bacterium]|nr:hypothetical protein [Clostridia bacterium]